MNIIGKNKSRTKHKPCEYRKARNDALVIPVVTHRRAFRPLAHRLKRDQMRRHRYRDISDLTMMLAPDEAEHVRSWAERTAIIPDLNRPRVVNPSKESRL
jgi:hypothetical protein